MGSLLIFRGCGNSPVEKKQVYYMSKWDSHKLQVCLSKHSSTFMHINIDMCNCD